VTVVFALLAGLANALSVVSQHAASSAERSTGSWWRLAVRVVTRPLWLLGAAALLGGFVFQALALHNGELSVVQPLMVTELAFTLALRRVWFHEDLHSAAWLAAGITCVGAAVFVAASEPQGGHPNPTESAWLAAGVTVGGLAVILAVLASWGSPTRRAALYASAAGLVWALEATFIKTTTDELTSKGLGATFTGWPVYALVGGGIAGSLLVQAALHVGPISVSQPLMVTVDPFVSVVLGIWLFGEHFTDNGLQLTVAFLAFFMMVAGVVFMSRTAPMTLGDTSAAFAEP